MVQPLKPVITHPILFQKDAVTELDQTSQNKELLLEYPVVYIVYDKSKGGYRVYVGETNDIEQRTQEHLGEDRTDWQEFRDNKNTEMLVIGHPHFNKSLTLDIENTMMMYMLGVNKVKTLNNRRTNQQYKYFTLDERSKIFSEIWQKLHRLNQDLFPIEQEIRDSAIFKASPFHKLTAGQETARKKIFQRITALSQAGAHHQLIMVEGEAGSGKTVLLSTLFYRLNHSDTDTPTPTQTHLIVNHKEQVKVYTNIAQKLDLDTDNVSLASTFIKFHTPDAPVDVVLVDEAHLLLTQGNQGYTGKNQLNDIMARSKITVIVFDRKQILKTEEYRTGSSILKLENHAQQQQNLIQLKEQLRLQANPKTLQWLHDLLEHHIIQPIPRDTSYDLRIFNDAQKMYNALKRQAANTQNGLSRVVATFDWPYKDSHRDQTYYVTAGNLSLPWNLQLKAPRGQGQLPWAEQSQTINEVGSTFTIQGFDLNYSAVIIGPSVKYRDGHLVFDREASQNRKAIQKRTFDNGNRSYVAEELLANELNVLMTRGVHGLYIYAVDDALRAALLAAEQH